MDQVKHPIFSEPVQTITIYASGHCPFVGVDIGVALSPQIFVAAHDFVQFPYLGSVFTCLTYTT